MARPSVSAQCDLVTSYMDGVHVKIAEAYKPPRKIGLPAPYNNRLPDVSKLVYDFSLERSVLEKMCEWRKARQACSEARQARLKEKRKKEEEETPPSPPPLDCAKQPINAPPASETILTPQPLSPPANDLRDLHVKTNGGLDFADFDNDTSSPFDNMELKTINDMEELAQVLQPRLQWVPAGKLENIINELRVDDKSEVCKEEKADTESPADDEADADAHSNENHRSVSAIMQELQKELERPVMEFFFAIELEAVARFGESGQRRACYHEAQRLDVESRETVGGFVIGHDGERSKISHATGRHGISQVQSGTRGIGNRPSEREEDRGIPVGRSILGGDWRPERLCRESADARAARSIQGEDLLRKFVHVEGSRISRGRSFRGISKV
ncbi:uncharacterized protein LOC143904037 isoform X2 [Temnothorax americanus]|uniref:uncharacterized protein LOC143904037 isoform X2 n=1 Tax=Temnothorax americanus TaxID=1964332 RepID=UPI00406819A5